MEEDDITFLFAHLRGRVIAQGLILRAVLNAFEPELREEIISILERFEPTVPLEGIIELGPGLSEVFLEGYRSEVNQFRQWLHQS